MRAGRLLAPSDTNGGPLLWSLIGGPLLQVKHFQDLVWTLRVTTENDRRVNVFAAAPNCPEGETRWSSTSGMEIATQNPKWALKS